jgi:hypothetical protein
MPSMSYCMFENTANEMAQCLDNVEDNLDNPEFLQDMSEYERDGIMQLVQLARRFARYEAFLQAQKNRLSY